MKRLHGTTSIPFSSLGQKARRQEVGESQNSRGRERASACVCGGWCGGELEGPLKVGHGQIAGNGIGTSRVSVI